MNNIKLFEEMERYCREHSCGSDSCELDEYCNKDISYLGANGDAVIKIVTEWSIANPIVTNNDRIHEIFGEELSLLLLNLSKTKEDSNLINEWLNRPYNGKTEEK